MPLPEVKLKCLFSASAITTVIVMFSVPSHAFFRNRLIGHLGMGRIDPIISPGHPSAHVHHLNGAKNIGFDSDAVVLGDSNCTTSILTQDKSAYWAPWMYFRHENGSFEPVNLTAGLTVYYKLEKRPDLQGANFTVFPKGFRMIAGSSLKRTWDGPWPVPDTSHWGPQDVTQSALAEKAIGFNCLHYYRGYNEPTFAYPYLRDKTFIDQSCPDGLRTEILFPSCWDGVNYDSEDHKSHVAYPPLLQDGKCPNTHPVYLPIIFYETIWNTAQFKDIAGQFILANGDPTGFGYHGDFVSAWDKGVLQTVMDDPSCTSQDPYHPDPRISGEVEGCRTFNGHIQSDDEAAKCQMETPEAIKDEQVTGLLTRLPGDVKVTGNRHDPGAPQDKASSSTVAGQPSLDLPSMPSLLQPSSVAISDTHPNASPWTDPIMTMTSNAASTPTTDNRLMTLTTAFTSQGYIVLMVLVEDVATVITVATPTITTTVTVSDEDAAASNYLPATSVANKDSHHLPHMRKHLGQVKNKHLGI